MKHVQQKESGSTDINLMNITNLYLLSWTVNANNAHLQRCYHEARRIHKLIENDC